MIKWIIKWVFRLAVLAVVVFVALLLSLDSLVKAAVVREIRARTGMDATIGSLDVGWLSPTLTVENFKVYNTAEYGGTPLVDMPDLYLEYDRTALFRRKLHIRLMRFNLAEVNVVRSDTGKTNLSSRELRVPRKAYSKWAGWFGGIDVLNISLGRAGYVDLKNPRLNREVNLGLKDQVFKKVQTIQELKAVFILLWLRGNGGVLGTGGSIAPHGLNVAAVCDRRIGAPRAPLQCLHGA